MWALPCAILSCGPSGGVVVRSARGSTEEATGRETTHGLDCATRSLRSRPSLNKQQLEQRQLLIGFVFVAGIMASQTKCDPDCSGGFVSAVGAAITSGPLARADREPSNCEYEAEKLTAHSCRGCSFLVWCVMCTACKPLTTAKSTTTAHITESLLFSLSAPTNPTTMCRYIL